MSLEGKIKGAIEGGITQSMKKAEAAKERLVTVTSNVEDLGKRI